MTPIGTHLIADFYGCARLDDPAHVEVALRGAVAASGATLLDLRLHHFGPGHGVTGVALLAESHLSIHTWPEHRYAAVDLFLCGAGAGLQPAVAALRDMLRPASLSTRVLGRGGGGEEREADVFRSDHDVTKAKFESVTAR